MMSLRIHTQLQKILFLNFHLSVIFPTLSGTTGVWLAIWSFSLTALSCTFHNLVFLWGKEVREKQGFSSHSLDHRGPLILLLWTRRQTFSAFQVFVWLMLPLPLQIYTPWALDFVWEQGKEKKIKGFSQFSISHKGIFPGPLIRKRGFLLELFMSSSTTQF